MMLYADLPVRRAWQVAGDLFVVLWTWLWIDVAHAVRDATLRLADPGRRIDSSASDLAGRLRDAGDSVARIPLVGDDVSSPFDGAGRAAQGLAGAGRQQVAAAESLAHWLGLTVALVPILLLLLLWLPPRVRFVRRASAGRRFLDSGADLDLFALRAMAHQPLHVLARVDDDPAGAWRRGETRVVDELARLELRASGLRPPRRPAAASGPRGAGTGGRLTP
ncbi:hypothetical protein SAMN04488570_0848 [Nocardioides scoriae]|uniref:Transmembrane protein n=1 Tax=Nocardioides scoriae TaxID=642780 RepID=A0A1H1NG34_9ACTN|nr:hypothetical protein [Nocardioides scoriae]SDR97269.1 hypothetical protein SAMN04488570_0848 [Nocardioides scoriae]